MSKNFVTKTSAATKLQGGGISGDAFINKQDLLNTGLCDESHLNDYSNSDFVINDDIVKRDKTYELRFQYNGLVDTGTNYDINFNPSKGFKIQGTIIFDDASQTMYSLWKSFYIYHSTLDVGNSGVEFTTINGGSSTAKLYVGVRGSSKNYTFQYTGAKINVEYSVYITYNPSNKKLLVRVTNGSILLINSEQTVEIINKDYNRIALCDDPKYGYKCVCNFLNFKIYQLV